MKNDNISNEQNLSTNDIPDIEIIDLENVGDTPAPSPEEDITSPEKSSQHSKKRSFRSFINMHAIFALSAILIIIGIYFSITTWGIRVDLDEIFKDGQGEYSDTLDSFLPLLTDAELPEDDGITTIVCFGNAPFADDRDSKDNLANIIAQEANATVYNCSISGSYLAAPGAASYTDGPSMDAYNFYWLMHLAIGNTTNDSSDASLEDGVPKEANEVFDTLTTLDFNTVDVIAIMYDASDYLAGHAMYDDANRTNITCFTGNLEAGIELIQSEFPHIRIIVMSPTYAFAVDQNGDYLSSDTVTYGWDVLSTYVIKQADSSSYCNVSFVDNLYGTITEDNASEFLTDHLHMNKKGRQKVAERFIEALTYYDK